MGLCENLVPSYNAEIAPARHRGLLAGSLITFTSAGNLWGAGMGRAFSTETQPKGWLIAVAMQFIPALLLIGLVPLTPESPRWLIQHGRHEQAAVNLNKLRRKEEVESGATAREIELLQQLVEESREIGQARWSDMIHGDIPRRVWVSPISSNRFQADRNRLSAPFSSFRRQTATNSSSPTRLHSTFHRVLAPTRSRTTSLAKWSV